MAHTMITAQHCNLHHVQVRGRLPFLEIHGKPSSHAVSGEFDPPESSDAVEHHWQAPCVHLADRTLLCDRSSNQSAVVDKM